MAGVIRVGGEKEPPSSAVPRIPIADRGLPNPQPFRSGVIGETGVPRAAGDVFTRQSVEALRSTLEAAPELVPAPTDVELAEAYRSGQREAGLMSPANIAVSGVVVRRTHTEEVVVEPTNGSQMPAGLLGALLGQVQPSPQLQSDYAMQIEPQYALPPSINPRQIAGATYPGVGTDLGDELFGQSAQVPVDIERPTRGRQKVPRPFLRGMAIILAPLLAGGLTISNWSKFDEGMHYLGQETGGALQGGSLDLETLKEAVHIFATGNRTHKDGE